MAPADRRLVAAALGVLAVVVIGIVVYSAYHGDGDICYPEALLDGSRVSRAVLGEQAVEMSRGIHWNPRSVDVEDAAIVDYENGVRLWISVSKNAESQVAVMVKKIREFDAMLPYSVMGSRTIDGKKVWFILDKRDPGKIHVLWAEGKLLVWAEIPSATVPNVLELVGYLVKNVRIG